LIGWIARPGIQKNINAYLAKDDYWIDVHLSKGDYTRADDKLFWQLLGAIRINEEYAPSAADYGAFGACFHQQRKWRERSLSLIPLERH
jgi:hypothetical protein